MIVLIEENTLVIEAANETEMEQLKKWEEGLIKEPYTSFILFRFGQIKESLLDRGRCDSYCQFPTPWSIRANTLPILGLAWAQTHCTLERNHAGQHLGPDDSTWD